VNQSFKWNFTKLKNVILINSRMSANKTLVSTDKSYKLVGISQKETLF